MFGQLERQPGLHFSPQLDGLRAFCIAFTVANHVDGTPRWIDGTVGVDVFFALSGFLITAILLQGQRAGDFSLRAFYIRRVFRIAPVYYLAFALTALAALGVAKAGGGVEKLWQLRASWEAVAAFSGEYRPAAAGTFFGHSWTIGIEEKFYILWPLLFCFVLKGPRALTVFLVLVPLVAGLLGPFEARGYGGIALGCLASILYFRYQLAPLAPAWGLALLAIAYAGVTSGVLDNSAMAAAAAVLIPGLYHFASSRPAKFLASAPLVWLGQLTFSIYMLHILCINVAKMVLPKVGVTSWLAVYGVAYAASVVAAWIVFKTVEKPFIVLGRRLAATRAAAPPTGDAVARA